MTIAAATGVALRSRPRKPGDNAPKKLSEYIEEAMLAKGRELAEEGVDNPKLARRRMNQARRQAITRWREEQAGRVQ